MRSLALALLVLFAAAPVSAQEDEDEGPALEAEPHHGGGTTRTDLPGAPRRLGQWESRQMPGTLGDPWRALEILPGMTPIFTGVPYPYLRGAPSGGTLVLWEDIPVPVLHHLGVGPSIIHPAMAGPVRLYPGVAPARFGRHIGGVVESEGPRPVTPDRGYGEAELRAVDLGAFFAMPVGDDGALMVATRHGIPGMIFSAASSDYRVVFGDYQLKLELPAGDHDRFELVWLGAYDSLRVHREELTQTVDFAFDFQVHRGELRVIRERDRMELGAALRLGFESASSEDDIDVSAFTLGGRFWGAYRGPHATFRAGAELIGALADIELDPDVDDQDVVPDPSDNPALAAIDARSMGGAYADLVLTPSRRVGIDLGVRGDLWMNGGELDWSVDPRARIRFQATRALDLHAAAGTAHQAPVFAVPMPVVAEVPLDEEPVRSIQSEVGAGLDLPAHFRTEIRLFFHRHHDLFYIDPFLNIDGLCLPSHPECATLLAERRSSQTVLGGELLLARSPDRPLSMLVSYTLGWALPDRLAGLLDYHPSWDVRHVLNAMLRWRHESGFTGALRFHLHSGRPAGGVAYDVDEDQMRVDRPEERLPAFVRADAYLAYLWHPRWGSLTVYLDFHNVTFLREALELSCPPGQDCEVRRTKVIVEPMLGIRAGF